MNNLKKLLYFLNRCFTTGLFIGYIPGAPGTYGSLLAAVFVFCFPGLSNLILITGLFFLGVISSQLEENRTGLKDEGKIVIDEIIGMFITFVGFSLSPIVIIIGFLLFRFFDIFKPFLIDRAQNLPGGWGVMADDVVAGIASNLLLQIILFTI